MRFLVLTVILVSHFVTVTLSSAALHFKISGKDLEPIESDWGVDGFAKLTVNGECQRTEIIKDDKNPEWRLGFVVNDYYGQSMELEVRHEQSGAADRTIGKATIYASNSGPIYLRRDGSNRGEILLRHEVVFYGEAACTECDKKCEKPENVS